MRAERPRALQSEGPAQQRARKVNALIRNLSWPCVHRVREVEVADWTFEKPVPVILVTRPV